MMSVVVPSMVPERAHKAIGDWRALMAKPAEHDYFIVDNSETNRGVLASMQEGYEKAGQPIIAYLHDDVDIAEENWDTRVEAEFADPSVGVVGFGGALWHGDADIYKTPYRLQQLGRGHYRSNTIDAESHGERFTGACDVATLDGFALIVRKELLDKAGGFPVDRMTFHSYDYWVCCMAHRLGYRVRVVGVKCQHHGGKTSTTPAYQEWIQKTHGKTDVQVHEESHRCIFDEFYDVLPWRCQP